MRLSLLGMVQAITILSESGGVGKTTTTINLAAALNRRGKDVLVIDTDPQPGSVTSLIGFQNLKDPDAGPKSLKQVLLSPDNEMDDIIVEASEFDLVPAAEDLTSFEMEANMKQIPGRELRVRNELESVASEYDYDHYIVDTPATLGLLVYNAIVATRNVLVPMEMTSKGELSIDGIEDTVAEIEHKLKQAQKDINLSLLGIVPNDLGQSNIYNDIQGNIENSGKDVFPVQIGSLDSLKYAERNRMTIFEYAEYHGLREYEQKLLREYDKLAQIITGEWDTTGDPQTMPVITMDGSQSVPDDHPRQKDKQMIEN